MSLHSWNVPGVTATAVGERTVCSLFLIIKSVTERLLLYQRKPPPHRYRPLFTSPEATIVSGFMCLFLGLFLSV